MTGTQLLIVAVIVMFVIAFVITMVVLNTHAKKIIDTNSKLVENQNAILEQNKVQENELSVDSRQLVFFYYTHLTSFHISYSDCR